MSDWNARKEALKAAAMGANLTPTPLTTQEIFDDLVARGIRARHAGDETKWLQGDLAVEFCREFGIDPKAGRPPAGKDGYTLAFYAAQIDVKYRRLSEFRLCSAFYPENIRRNGDYQTWAHHNTARRASENNLENALELLDKAVALHLNSDQFDAYCAGDYYEGVIDFDEIPARIQAFIPAGKPVWAKYSAYYPPTDERGEE